MERTGNGDALVHYPVCSDPLQPFPPLFLQRCFAESSWESRLVVAVLEDDRVIHPSHHGRVKGAGSRVCLGAEFKNILKPHILPAQKHQKHQRSFLLTLFEL